MPNPQPITAKYRGSQKYLLVYSELIQAARYRGKVTYQEIAQIMGLPLQGSHMGRETGHMLGEISEDEHKQGRPMLSAVAISVTGSPGPGFFSMARILEKLAETATKEEEQAFWEAEMAALYQTWKRDLANK